MQLGGRLSRMHVIGIGNEIVECLRIARMIQRHGELFIDRVFTPAEIEFCRNRALATQHYAGRWAAKEAILKAIGTPWRKGLGWRDIEVRKHAEGRPVVHVYGGAAELCDDLGIERFQVSISHCRTFATAFAIALGSRPPE